MPHLSRESPHLECPIQARPAQPARGGAADGHQRCHHRLSRDWQVAVGSAGRGNPSTCLSIPARQKAIAGWMQSTGSSKSPRILCFPPKWHTILFRAYLRHFGGKCEAGLFELSLGALTDVTVVRVEQVEDYSYIGKSLGPRFYSLTHIEICLPALPDLPQVVSLPPELLDRVVRVAASITGSDQCRRGWENNIGAM